MGLFEQASAEPSLLELCRAQPKNMNVVRNFSFSPYFWGIAEICQETRKADSGNLWIRYVKFY